MKRDLQRHRSMFAQLAIGGILGVLLLHPLTTLVFYFEFNDMLAEPSANAWSFMANRLQVSTFQELVPMSTVFAVLGAGLGLVIFLQRDDRNGTPTGALVRARAEHAPAKPNYSRRKRAVGVRIYAGLKPSRIKSR